MSNLPRLESLPDPGDRFTLQDVIGIGVCGKVYKAIDNESDGKIVAIKIQQYETDLISSINEEYRVYRDFSNHPNLPAFYGVYCKKQPTVDEIWFIIEYCEGGPIIDLVRGLQALNKRMSEEHIAYILRETAKALHHLHSNHVIHRDVRGNNILLTREGEIKLCDFGLSRDLKSTMGKRGTCVGSPSWMAPEIITGSPDEKEVYGSRADVWALGITAIELGDGKPPFADIHPTRAMFQIVRNPPPTLYRPANWSQNFNDFIAECLEKHHDHRPYLVELLEHPFFTELPENDYFLSQELKVFWNDIGQPESVNKPEISIHKDFMKKHNTKPEKMCVEDLAALEKITEEKILTELKTRMDEGDSYTFIGDVLLSLNSNELPLEFDRTFHSRYSYKSRSDNAPHIFAVADSAYQDMLHHEEPQHIVLSGESFSGKTTNFLHLVNHLCVLGEGHKGMTSRIESAISTIHALVNAGTPVNPNATKCFMQTQLTFGSSGKMSGAIFWIYLLEKLRVSSTDMSQSNFHIFYYFYDAIEAEERLKDFNLENGRNYRYLRIPENDNSNKLKYCRDSPAENAEKFKLFEQHLLNLDFQNDQIENMYNILAAILILGNVRFADGENGGKAELENLEMAQKVAKLLGVDEKKFQWALLNYCVVEKGTAERRRHTADEARDARDVLASTIYCRLVDWIVNTINQKLSLSRAVYGDMHSVTITDLFGFECFPRNRIEQLVINCINEQMQYQYNQRMFAFEMIDLEEEHIPGVKLHYYDNKNTIDNLLNKPEGLFCLMDDISKGRHGYEFLTDSIAMKKSPYLQRVSSHEFSIAHYTGTVIYDVRDFSDKNRDFLPPEMVETLRASTDETVKTMFTNLLSKTGNLTMANSNLGSQKPGNKKNKWGDALVAEKCKAQRLNTLSHGQYSQIHKMRTLAAVFRATSLDILKGLAIGANTGGTHYVRCIRADLDNKPRGFQSELVRQQIKAMAVLDTGMAKQCGFSHRIAFQEFLRRYKFLAFDFDENVELTKDNCRLLLIRLKLEGWVIGNSKVFLKYYNEEYLSRLYETQVKKIIKVQCMMRAFLAKRNVASKLKKFKRENSETNPITKKSSIVLNEEEAVIRIQKAYRGYIVRKQYGPLINAKTGKLDQETAKFVKDFAKRWRAKTIYQVLLHYRSARYLDLVNFSQQVHIYNQRLASGLTMTSQCLLLDRIDSNQKNASLLGPVRPPVWKLPFRLDEIPYFDTTYMCDPTQANTNYTGQDSDDEDWDAPLRRRPTLSSDIIKKTNFERSHTFSSSNSYEYVDETIVNEPFIRDPNIPMKRRAPKPPTQRSTYINNRSSPIKSSIKSYSPTPYVRQSVDDIRSKFVDNNVVVGSQAVVYKKRQAPKTPIHNVDVDKPVLRSSLKKRPAPQPTINNREWEPKSGSDFSYSALESRKPFNSPTHNKINPIKELQMIGKRNGGEPDEDEPPFNFQGMLRKTKYNRASMKRSTDGKMSLAPGMDVNENNGGNRKSTQFTMIEDMNDNSYGKMKISRSRTPENGYVETSNNYTNVVYHSNKGQDRPKSCLGLVENGNDMSIVSIANDENEDPNSNNVNENDFDPSFGPYIKEEILPGIILEGYVAHF